MVLKRRRRNPKYVPRPFLMETPLQRGVMTLTRIPFPQAKTSAMVYVLENCLLHYVLKLRSVIIKINLLGYKVQVQLAWFSCIMTRVYFWYVTEKV